MEEVTIEERINRKTHPEKWKPLTIWKFKTQLEFAINQLEKYQKDYEIEEQLTESTRNGKPYPTGRARIWAEWSEKEP